jgi:hypothetical protein
MAWDQATMKVSPMTYQRVTVIKQLMETEKQRQVTYSEVLEELARTWEAGRVEEQRKMVIP